jgi:hypothetical protein
MKDVQLKLLQRCIRDLEALGCTFAIIDLDGAKHGTLEVVDPKARKAKSEFEYGSVTKYIEPFVKDLKIGEIAEIPVNEFGHARLQSVSGSWFYRVHGAGSQTSTHNKEKNTIELMRLA